MSDFSQASEHMEVVGSDGIHVGSVDRLQDDMIRLTGSDSLDGRARAIPAEWVDRIEDKVYLNRTSEEALSEIDRGTGVAGAVGNLGVAGAFGIAPVADEALANRNRSDRNR